MALRRSYEREEEIPKEVRCFYVEQDGQFMLDAEPAEEDHYAEELRKILRERDLVRATRRYYRELTEINSKNKQLKMGPS